jgi:hypothetical protein
VEQQVAAAETPNINVLADPIERVDKPLPGVKGESGTSRWGSLLCRPRKLFAGMSSIQQA